MVIYLQTWLRALFARSLHSPLFAALSACFVLFEVVNGQTTITIGALKDNTLYESTTGTVSNGAGEHFFVGNTGQTAPSSATRRGLVAFDVAAKVPAGATVTAVTLTLNMSKSKTTTGQSIELHRALKNWGEGTSNAAANEGSGAAATTGDATWLHTFFSTNLWDKIGGDFSTVISASKSVGATGSYTWASTSQLVSDVQGWLDSPNGNFGWVIVGDESTASSSKRFDSRENATASLRPALSITFTIPTQVRQTDDIPLGYNLSQNFPNPFNPVTEIKFTIGDPLQGPASDQRVILTIYNILGKEVEKPVNERLGPGEYVVRWNAAGFSSGIYFYRLVVGADDQSHFYSSQLRKMILIK